MSATPALTIDQTTSDAGDGKFIAIRGVEFSRGDTVSVYVGGNYAADCVTDDQGSFDCQIQIPRDLVAGSYQVAALDGAGGQDSQAFTVV